MLRHCWPDLFLIQAKYPLVMAHCQLEQRMMPGEVDAVGCPPVKSLEPGAQKIPAAGSVTKLEKRVGDGVGGNSATRAQGQGALRQSACCLKVSRFMVRKSILSQ